MHWTRASHQGQVTMDSARSGAAGKGEKEEVQLQKNDWRETGIKSLRVSTALDLQPHSTKSHTHNANLKKIGATEGRDTGGRTRSFLKIHKEAISILS